MRTTAALILLLFAITEAGCAGPVGVAALPLLVPIAIVDGLVQGVHEGIKGRRAGGTGYRSANDATCRSTASSDNLKQAMGCPPETFPP